MTSRAGRVAVIAAAFGVQAAIFAGIGGLASVSQHADAGYARSSMPVMAPLPAASGLPAGAITITMSTEGQIGFAAIPAYDSPQASLLQMALLQLTPGVNADVRMAVNIPQGYPLDGFRLGFGPAQATGPGAMLSMNPLLTVRNPGPGAHEYRFSVPAQYVGSGENLMMSVQNSDHSQSWYPLALLPAS
jgi:hypothetical protein